MLEKQATHIPGAGQNREKQNRWTSGRNSQVYSDWVTFKWLNQDHVLFNLIYLS